MPEKLLKNLWHLCCNALQNEIEMKMFLCTHGTTLSEINFTDVYKK